MDIEKEVRYHVTDESWDKILNNTIAYKPKSRMLDITLGLYGFSSLEKTNTIYRVRHKNSKTTIEIKKRTSANSWLESIVRVDSVKQGLEFFTLMGLTPYLYIARDREVRLYKNLKIFLDDVDLIGKYVEIEYQDSDHTLEEIQSFLDENSIIDSPAPLYGDIFKQNLESSNEFKATFHEKLESMLK